MIPRSEGTARQIEPLISTLSSLSKTTSFTFLSVRQIKFTLIDKTRDSIRCMIGVYLRVSTKDQTTASQKHEIGQWLSGQSIAPAGVTWYEDHETGTTLERPAFERLQAAIFSGTVKTVVVWKLDRLSRRLQDGVNLLADWTAKGVRVVVVTQQLDLSGILGRTIAALLLGLAEIEHGHIKERQKAGIAAARKRGAYKGRQPGTQKASPERARELAAKGLKPAEIATALGISPRTVERYLK